MKILVTGAHGFVGQALCRHIRASGHELVAVVRQVATECDEIALGTLDAQTDWRNALSGVDVVVHLAGRAHAADASGDDVDAIYHAANVEVTRNLAEQAREAGVQRFVFVSTIKVNGESTLPGRPFLADDTPAPEDAYGRSKLEAERCVAGLCAGSPMTYTVIRPPLVYGPGVKANFRSMMKWLCRGLPLPLGAIDNQRSLVGLENLVDLIMTAMRHPMAANQVFLAGDGEDLSTPALLTCLGSALGYKARLLPVPAAWLRGLAGCLGKASVARRLCASLQVDIDKTCSRLDWMPPITTEQGLRQTAAAFLEERTRD
ncbi:MAG: SDR family oxidoreductase [Rhodocyclaceae bacterium]|nr:SDR family oxidoreductase [Rhodocyclaceae bacterium]